MHAFRKSHGGPVWPLVTALGRVTVDGHSICDQCGAAVVPVAPDRWQHAPANQPYPDTSRWLGAVDRHELCRLETYEQFCERYPWTVRPELGAGAITCADEWQDARNRLIAYDRLLTSAVSPSARDQVDAKDNQYLRMVQVLSGLERPGPNWPMRRGMAQVLNVPACRRELAAAFSWAIPSPDVIAAIAAYSPLIDCGAGTGYWAALLAAQGADVVAYDLNPPDQSANEFHTGGDMWFAVQQADSVEALARHRNRTLIMCWPPYQDDRASYVTLRAYQGSTLVYLGDGADGTSGSVRFHRELGLNWHPVEERALPNWPGLRDRLTIYKRNPVRRQLLERDRCPECGHFVTTGTIGRCDVCFRARPPALALRHGPHRIEYPQDALDGMPPALRMAFEHSPNRIMTNSVRVNAQSRHKLR